MLGFLRRCLDLGSFPPALSRDSNCSCRWLRFRAKAFVRPTWRMTFLCSFRGSRRQCVALVLVLPREAGGNAAVVWRACNQRGLHPWGGRRLLLRSSCNAAGNPRPKPSWRVAQGGGSAQSPVVFANKVVELARAGLCILYFQVSRSCVRLRRLGCEDRPVELGHGLRKGVWKECLLLPGCLIRTFFSVSRDNKKGRKPQTRAGS